MTAPSPPPKSTSRSLGAWGWIAIGALGAALGAAVWFALYAWNMLAGVEMSTNGVIAMIMGIVLATALGAALMALLFWSHRKGYDR